MYKKIFGLLILISILAACSTPPVVPTLNGKKRERINAVVYETPPLIVVHSDDNDSQK